MPDRSQSGSSSNGSDSDAGAGGSGSARDSLGELCRGLNEHLKARAELLGIETGEAASFLARKAACAIAAAILSGIAYAVVGIALVSLLGRWLEASWPDTFAGLGWQLVALAAGVMHLLAALVLFRRLKGKPARPLFEFTRSEIQKDRQWLTDNTSSKGKDSSS